MTTNAYFQSKGTFQERLLVNDLIEECIQFAGNDVYYIPRNTNNYDHILGEDNRSTFNLAIPIEVYLEDHSAPRGASEIVSKFGFEIKDSYTLSMSPKRFKEEVVTRNVDGILSMPRTGDLIFMDFKVDDSNNNWTLMEIKFVQNEEPHYQFGQNSMWKLDCEMFRYNNEKFNTGLPLLDKYAFGLGIDNSEFRLILSNGTEIMLSGNTTTYLMTSTNYHNENQNIVIESNDYIQTEAQTIVQDFNNANPFGKF